MFFKQARAKQMQLISPSEAEAIFAKEAAKELRRVPLDPQRNFYMDIWAVSADEKWGPNDNADGFERKELLASHQTFVDSWACLDHENQHEGLAVGRNIDAIYTPEDYVRIVMGVDRAKAERRRPGLEAKIVAKQITDTSMGCWAKISVCSICANVATDPAEFCDHIRNHRGQLLRNADTKWEEKLAYEKNRGVVFFEDSIITDSEGADKNAKILNKLAAQFSPQVGFPPERLYKVLREMGKTASTEEKALLTLLVEQLTQHILERVD